MAHLRRRLMTALFCGLAAAWLAAAPGLAGDLDDLARPHAGRSMRRTAQGAYPDIGQPH